jgi:sirohydrochlorin cobaltochelatase
LDVRKWSILLNTHVVLATHGSPPRDFPAEEMREFFELHSRLGHAVEANDPAATRYEELEKKMRAWRRTPQNDSFHTASLELASYMEKYIQMPVFTAFNEFCAPTVSEALENSAEMGASRVIVITSMLTRGGEHAEVDIREAVQKAGREHPEIEFRFAFPFPAKDIAHFLAEQVKNFNSI